MSSDKPTQQEQIQSAVNTCSSPADLKITDIRCAVVASNYDYPIIRIDTNQGVYGIGEVRDAGHIENALQFKSILVGENPCNIDRIYQSIKSYGNHRREGGGVSGIEIALYDLIGKVYGVPCWQFLGGKYRDQVRVYADTPAPHEPTPEGYAERVKERLDMGLTFIKFDLTPRVVADIPGMLSGGRTRHDYPRIGDRPAVAGTGEHIKLTQKAIDYLVDIVRTVRETVGWDVALCVDHFGHGYLTINEVIRLANAVEPYNLSWLEDPMPWWDIEGHRLVTRAINTPVAAGEELYLRAGFREMIQTRAVDIIHPDLLTSGGMMETKRIADDASEYDIPTALHFAGSPIACMANVHCAAAIGDFVALENHALDIPYWTSLVTGMDDPLMVDGYIRVPSKPGLGIDLNYEAIEEHLRRPGLFESTEYWDTPKLGFWRPCPEEDWD